MTSARPQGNTLPLCGLGMPLCQAGSGLTCPSHRDPCAQHRCAGRGTAPGRQQCGSPARFPALSLRSAAPAAAAWENGQMTDSGGSRRPNASRIYNCLLGGKDNYSEDREAAERLLAVVPDARAAAWDSRRFLARAVRFLVKDAGIRQFIDIGTGLPVMGNVHEVAHELAPDTRVAYVDYDPVVVSHARALLCTAPGVCAIWGDLRDPSGILDDPVLQAQVDLREPAAILLAGVLHFIPDDDDPYRLVNILKAAMAPGSHLVISHLTGDSIAPDALEQAQAIYAQAAAPAAPRSRAGIARFFDGLQLVTPGIADVAAWQAGPQPVVPRRAIFLGGAGRKL